MPLKSVTKCNKTVYSISIRRQKRHFSNYHQDQILHRPRRIFISAGEPSGDILGSKLMSALKRQAPTEFHGIGGYLMQREGLKPLFDMNDLSVMGFAEVIPHFFNLKRRIDQTAAEIMRIQPDAIVTIDSKGFHFRLLKKIKAQKMKAPVIHYVGPTSAWLSNQDTSTLNNIIDHLLLLYPFESKYYSHVKYGVTYVGHPLLEDCMQQGSDFHRGNRTSFRQQLFNDFRLPSTCQIIGVLPGSRKQEVDRMLPLFMESSKLFQQSINKQIHVIIPTIPHMMWNIKETLHSLTNSNVTYSVVDSTDMPSKYDALSACDVAIAASGTVVIELAIARVPTVVGMTFHPITNTILHLLKKYTKQFSNFKFATIPNIVLDKQIVPELLLEQCTPENIANTMRELMGNESQKIQQMEGFQQTLSKLVPPNWMLGPKTTPSEAAASAIADMLKNKAET